jgi:hypothetical protein
MTSRETQAQATLQPNDAPATPLPEVAKKDPVSPQALKWVTRLLLLYFGARLIFFALSISSYVPPDEVTHLGVCGAFSKFFLFPENSPETYQFGPVTNIPWLYYWSMGKLLHLNLSGLPDLVFLRLLNIPLAFGTVAYALRLLRLFTEDRLARILLLVMATNTAMFTLLSASVSYDNLTNLLAVMAIYYLFAFFRDRSAEHLAASLLCQMLGSLAKITMLPLILALGVVLVVHEAGRLPDLGGSLKHYLRTSRSRALSMLLLLLVALGCNLALYGGNYLKFGTVNPPMSTIVSPSAAMAYRMEARGMIFNQFKDGKLSYMDALILAGEIKHPGDKADTFRLLMNYENLKADPGLWMNPAQYASFWFQTMTGTILGIKGHLGMFKSPGYLMPVYLVMALSVLGFLVRWRPRRSGWQAPLLIAIVFFYAGYLMHEINYDSYLNYGEPGITVFGRYLFPIIFAVMVLGCHYLLQLFRNDHLRMALAASTALLFLCYDFPWFVFHATSEWFRWLPQ